jgi:hypothetical protein
MQLLLNYEKIFKFLKIYSSLQYKVLCHLSCIVGGVYLPGFAVIFLFESKIARVPVSKFMNLVYALYLVV